MIIIVEGIDRVGKTTFIDKMCKINPTLIRFKDENICSKQYTDNDFSSFSLGKLDTSVNFLKQLNDRGYNIIVDRLHLTELVYGEIERNSTAYKEIGQLDTLLSKMKTILVLVEPTDLNWSNEQAGKDQSSHNRAFKCHYINSAIEKYHTNFNKLDDTIKIINRRMSLMNKDTADGAISILDFFGDKCNDTIEQINKNINFTDITTQEILNTFEIDTSLTMNFKYDVKNKIDSKYGPYLLNKYHEIFDKLYVAMQRLIDNGINTRQCIIQFEKEHCFQNIQFLIRDNKLIVICNMRSCNAIDNFKADVFICSILADEYKDMYYKMFNKTLEQTHHIVMNIGSFHKFIKEDDTDACK